ncbi:MAG TPA: alpha/beta hydrolase fold domain-containing protein [Solimonas sp.]|nr:alpha/beta hydrolase fold domain-containing protein [Solimonas sp.]
MDDAPVSPIRISRRSSLLLRQMRRFLRPMLHSLALAPSPTFQLYQTVFPRTRQPRVGRLPLSYAGLGGAPGAVLGDLRDADQNLVLYLHGGGFYLPAIPLLHLGFHARLCRDLGAVGFMPDYRLTPQHRYPAALDDCERAYRAALAAGFAPQRIVLVGESAGGNLVLTLLHRLRRLGLPLPACGVCISAVTDLTGLHALPSRRRNRALDPLVPPSALRCALDFYSGDADRADPELSPLYANFAGYPPLHFLAADTEIMLDDSVWAEQRARRAGVITRLDIWPQLPHAFPLFARWFPEARQARHDIAAFLRQHLSTAPATVPNP